MRNPFRRQSALDLGARSKVLAYLLLLAWSFVVLFPLYWLAITSLKTPLIVNSGPAYIPLVDFQPTLANWQYLVVDTARDTFRPLINTTIVGVSSAILALILGSLAGYGLVRFKYRPRVGVIASGIGCIALAVVAIAFGAPLPVAVVAAVAVLLLLVRAIGRRPQRRLGNTDISFYLLSQRMLPPVAVVIPIYVLFQRLGMLDTLQALIVTYAATNLPIVVWLMSDYFAGVPAELEEAAAVDGASPYRVFRSVILPVSRPGLVATFVLVLVFAWNEYLLALFLATANAETMPLLVAAQNATRGPQYWYMSVLILIMIIPVIAMAVVLERYITRGVLTGAVKG